jgi:hypothetical protein
MNERFTLILKDEPLPDDVPTAIRLRKMLKHLLRSYRFRCECITCNEPAKNGTELDGDAFSGGGMTQNPSEEPERGKRALACQQHEIEVF